jgi:TonB family protein
MRIIPNVLTLLLSFPAIAQVYIHPLAERIGDDAFALYMNEKGEIVSQESEYTFRRDAFYNKKEAAYSIMVSNKDGKLLAKSTAVEIDPIFTRYADSYLELNANGDTLNYTPFKKGKADGLSLSYHENGKLKVEGNFEKGLKVGTWNYFDETGSLVATEDYKDGTPNGTWNGYYANGNVKLKKSFINGKPIGSETHYFEDGSTREVSIEDDNGKVTKTIRYHENGEKREVGIYQDQLRSGNWEGWHQDGTFHYKGAYLSGNRTGNWIILSESNDTLLFGNYVDGVFTGLERAYSASGKLVYESKYSDGSLLYTTWYNADGACYAVRQIGSGTFGPCGNTEDQFEVEWQTPPSFEEHLEAFIIKTVVPEVNKHEQHYGAYQISVNRNGKVAKMKVLEPTWPGLDEYLAGALQSVNWNAGTYFGYQAAYTNELSIYLDSTGLHVKVGAWYLDDSLLLMQNDKHVPARTNHVASFESLPYYSGGMGALGEWISGEMKYPTFAKENGLSGETIVAFTVEKSGILSNISVVKNASPSLDREALRITRNLPLWKSGVKDGAAQRVVYKLPYRFTLR